ncbi:MAG: hypothetical protein WCP55_09435 [Lentisphaerota bacterium]
MNLKMIAIMFSIATLLLYGCGAASFENALSRQADGKDAYLAPDSTPAIFKFDFGMPPSDWNVPDNQKDNLYAQIYGASKESGKVCQGYLPVHPWSYYDAKSGYGWLDKSSFHGRPYWRDDVLGSLYYCQESYPEYEMLNDGICFYNENEHKFKVNLPPGKYRLLIYLGDLNLGESREAMTVKANGEIIIDKASTEAGQVKAFPADVEIKDGGLELSFEAPNQISVCGLEIRPLTANTPISAIKSFPPESSSKVTVVKGNLERFVASENLKLQQAEKDIVKARLFGDKITELDPVTGATEIYMTMYGDVSRLVSLAPEVELDEMAQLLEKMGISMISVKSSIVLSKYKKLGLKVTGGIHAERLPPNAENVEMQKLLKPDGSFGELKGFWSIHSPAIQKTFSSNYDKEIAPIKDEADAIFVDEPRGMTFLGNLLGDYSESSKTAFNLWCRENKLPEYGKTELPRPDWSDAFYAFYRFRLDSVPIFMRNAVKGSCVEKLPLYAGNGDISPGTLNHSTFFPPANAKAGIVPLSWVYTNPWMAKLSAEAMKATEVYGHNGMVFTRVGNVNEAVDRLQGLTVLSSRCAGLGPREGHSFRLFVEFAVMARALANTEHRCGLYLYWPESLVYPDLINWKNQIGQNWNEKTKSLFDQNIDYKISYDARLPENSMLLYYTPVPVISETELASLKSMLARGNKLLYAAPNYPVRPDGHRYGDSLVEIFGDENAKNIVMLKNFPDHVKLRELAERFKIELNTVLQADQPLLTYNFSQGKDQLLLIINASVKESVNCELPEGATDYFTKEKLSGKINIESGLFRLVKFK